MKQLHRVICGTAGIYFGFPLVWDVSLPLPIILVGAFIGSIGILSVVEFISTGVKSLYD